MNRLPSGSDLHLSLEAAIARDMDKVKQWRLLRNRDDGERNAVRQMCRVVKEVAALHEVASSLVSDVPREAPTSAPLQWARTSSNLADAPSRLVHVTPHASITTEMTTLAEHTGPGPVRIGSEPNYE